jgi:hypothetical protein
MSTGFLQEGRKECNDNDDDNNNNNNNDDDDNNWKFI